MPLIDAVTAACKRLTDADPGWKALLAAHGLNPAAANPAAALGKPLVVNRTLVGFEDFADDGVRGVEPGSPARSLLYHALASPNVLKAPDGTP